MGFNKTMGDFVSGAAEALNRNNLAGAEELLVKALEKDPLNPAASLILGVVFMRTHRVEQAIGKFERILAQDPDSTEALKWITQALRKTGRIEEAHAFASRSLELEPDSAEARYVRAMCLLAIARYVEAESDLRIVLNTEKSPSALHFLGISLMRQEKLDEATDFLREAARIEPQIPNHLVALGQVYLLKKDVGNAIACGEAALRLKPNDLEALHVLANASTIEGLTEESEKYIVKSLEVRPDSAEANGLYGMWLHQMGRFDEAEQFIDRALELDPNQAMPLFYKVQHRKIRAEDKELIQRLESRVQEPATTTKERLTLHYGLGKVYSDLGGLPEAFRHFDEANRLSYNLERHLEPYDQKALEHFADRDIQVFTKETLDKWGQFGNPSNKPIFVVGMIRSGTTLMEQLISAHPSVAGAGELRYWPDVALTLLDETSLSLDVSKMEAVCNGYLGILKKRSESARFVTDKMPTNLWMLGFIHSCFPNAKIIDMVRDPVDIAFSIWMTFFGKPPPFANNKRNIVDAIRQHERLRQHWHRVLPADRYLQVRYEDLTADPETVMRKVLAFCSLSWDEATIHPEKNDRFVTTPSLYRVRKPIDTGSVSKLERFAPFLGEFSELDQ